MKIYNILFLEIWILILLVVKKKHEKSVLIQGEFMISKCKKVIGSLLILFKAAEQFFLRTKIRIVTCIKKKFEYFKAYAELRDYKDLKYDDLTPKDNCDESGMYIKSLDWAINNEDVTNIALTGNYGSGKSSILKTYEKRRSEHHYLNISLATFYDMSKTKELEKNNQTADNKGVSAEQSKNKDTFNKIEFNDNEIEKGILEQLFYRVDSNKIPYSRFRKIKNIKNHAILFKVILLLIITLLGVFIFKKSDLNNFINETVKNEFPVKLISLGVFSVLIMYCLVKIIKYCNSRFRLSKFSVEKAQIEIDKKDTDSIFNKYIDEILYFFEATKYNVVVIEDLDRFNNTRIFIKLRELNSLINNYEKIKRRIVFIYAVKDDLFEENERTKFFDFIIPVIPVLSNVNSGDKLLSKIRQDELGKDISDEFINGVSVYINDMRMLNNIYNEYIIHRKVLNDKYLMSERLLALTIYKNLYPKDFAELQRGKGLVFEAFGKKNDIVNKEISTYLNEIMELRGKLEKADEDRLNSLNEVKVAFLNRLADNKVFGKFRYKNSNSYYYTEITRSEFMQNNFEVSRVFRDNIEVNAVNGSYKNINLSDVNSPFYEYKERMECIKYKEKEKQEAAKAHIEELNEKIRTISSYTLEKLMDEYGVKEVLGEKICNEKPIVYLLRHGYIDETYVNYLTYFYEGSITAQDMDFIMSIRNHEAKNCYYKLVKIEKVIKKLNKYEFEQKEILNVQLLNYLLKNKKDYVAQLDRFMRKLSDESKESIMFISCFIDNQEYQELRTDFWNMLCEKWTNIWVYIKRESQWEEHRLLYYFKEIIEVVKLDTLKKINIDDELKDSIKNTGSFVELVSDMDLDKIKMLISDLDVEFKVISMENPNKEILDYIYDGCYYEFNIQIIEDILNRKCLMDLNDIRSRNFSCIIDSNYNDLIGYILANIQQYIEEVFLKLDGNVHEDYERIIELLTMVDDALSYELKEKIIVKEEFEIHDISEVSEKLWGALFANCKVKVTWENVLKYYDKYKLDEILIKYLNTGNVYNLLKDEKYEVNNDKDNRKRFTEMLIKCARLEDSFEYLVNSIPFKFTTFDMKELSENRMKLLIEHDIFIFNVDIFNELKENSEDNHILFIENNIEDYLKDISKYKVDADDMYKLLSSDSCKRKDKILVIQKIKEISSCELNKKLAECIFDLLKREEESVKIDEDLYLKIFDLLEYEKKILFLADQAGSLDEKEIDTSLKKLGNPFDKITESLARPKINNTEENLRLGRALEKCNYISRCTSVDKKLIQLNCRKRN